MTTVTAAAVTTRPARHGPQGGPPLWLLALIYAALMLAGVVTSATTPPPSAPAEALQAYQQGHRGMMQLAAFFWFGSAVPLAIWAATAYRRLRQLGVTAPGTAIGFAGGVLAAGSVSLLGLITWVRSQTADLTDPALARALADFGFALGAAGYAVPFALLMAGVTVPSLILRFLPRPLAWTGLGIAAIGMLTTATLLTPALDVTLPIVRFGGLLWLIAASFLLPRTRPRRSTPQPARSR
jgi:hypothetical protein